MSNIFHLSDFRGIPDSQKKSRKTEAKGKASHQPESPETRLLNEMFRSAGLPVPGRTIRRAGMRVKLTEEGRSGSAGKPTVSNSPQAGDPMATPYTARETEQALRIQQLETEQRLAAVEERLESKLDNIEKSVDAKLDAMLAQMRTFGEKVDRFYWIGGALFLFFSIITPIVFGLYTWRLSEMREDNERRGVTIERASENSVNELRQEMNGKFDEILKRLPTSNK